MLSTSDLNSGLELIGTFECIRLLRSQDVGRLAVVIDGRPEVFPVNYIVDDDDTVVFQSGPGAKLAGALGGPVAFEVDQLDRAQRCGWSVVVHGSTTQVSLPDAVLLRGRMASEAALPWPRPRKPYLMRIVAIGVSGRRIPA